MEQLPNALAQARMRQEVLATLLRSPIARPAPPPPDWDVERATQAEAGQPRIVLHIDHTNEPGKLVWTVSVTIDGRSFIEPTPCGPGHAHSSLNRFCNDALTAAGAVFDVKLAAMIHHQLYRTKWTGPLG